MRIGTSWRACALSAALATLAAVAPAATIMTPKVTATALATPLPLPYDEAADAHAAVAGAKARAKAGHKYLLLDFGGNWCPDCRVLAGVLDLPEVKPAVQQTFEVVSIDVGRRTKNLDIAQQYGVAVQGVPMLVIVDPDGHFVNSGNPSALSDARSMSPQAIVDTIYGWIGASH